MEFREREKGILVFRTNLEVARTARKEEIKRSEEMIRALENTNFSEDYIEIVKKAGLINPEYEKIISFFYLDDFEVTSCGGKPKEVSCCKTKIIIERKLTLIKAEGIGVGIVDSMLDATRNALKPDYPEIENVFLSDFRITSSGLGYGNDQEILSLLELSTKDTTWVCVGFADDLVKAIWSSISGAINHYLFKANESCD